MGVLSAAGIGIDLGTENTVIALENEGVVLREPTCVLTAYDNENEVFALGREAKRMNGRTDADTLLYEPVQYGAVSAAVIGKQGEIGHHQSAAADIVVRITGSCKAALVVDSGLDGELFSCLELVLPLGTNLNDLAAELVAEDDGVFSYVVGNSLVACALKRCLMGGHTNTVGNNFYKNFIVRDLRKLKLLEAKIVLTVKSDCFCFHGCILS